MVNDWSLRFVNSCWNTSRIWYKFHRTSRVRFHNHSWFTICWLQNSWIAKVVFIHANLESSRDTCSWKGQLERTRNWKVLSWKALSWKVWSWKVSLKLERAKKSWKEPSEVGKFNWLTFPTSVVAFQSQWFFQLNWKLSNFYSHFSTSARTFQLKPELFNFSANFLTSFFPISCLTFQLVFFQLHLSQ